MLKQDEMLQFFIEFEPRSAKFFTTILEDYKTNYQDEEFKVDLDEEIKFLFEPSPDNLENKGIITSRLWQICIANRTNITLLQNAINNRLKELQPITQNNINDKFDAFLKSFCNPI